MSDGLKKEVRTLYRMGGHRGPMGGPRMGFSPGMGFRPMRMRHRPMGFFPMGGFFILPALIFGGWIAIAVISGVLSLIGSIIGGVFEGLGALAEGAFSGSGLVIGIVIGLLAFCYFRNRKKADAARQESTGTVDGVEVEQIIGQEKGYRTNF